MVWRMTRSAPLAIVITLYITTGVCWWISIPLGQSPDEFVHADYPSFIVENRRLPILGRDICSRATSDVRWFTATAGKYKPSGVSERHSEYEERFRGTEFDWSDPSPFLLLEAGQAPLAYLLPAATIYPWRENLGPLERWQISRLWSFIAGLAAIFAGWFAGRRLWPHHPHAGGLALATWMLALPMAQFLRSVASNDSLTLSFAAWICALVICWRRVTSLRCWLLGFLLAGGLLTKASILAFVPVVGFWLIASGGGWRALMPRLLPSFGPSAIALGIYYAGTPAYASWHYCNVNIAFFYLTNSSPVHFLDTLPTWVGKWRDFFGAYGSICNIPTPAALWWGALSLPAILSCMAGQAKSAPVRRALTVTGIVLVVLLVAAIREIFATGQTPLTGRHLLILQLPAGVILIHGWTAIANRFSQGKLFGSRLPVAVASMLAIFTLVMNRHDLHKVIQMTHLDTHMSVWTPASPVFSWVCGNLPEFLKIPLLWYATYAVATIVTYCLIAWFACQIFRLGILARRGHATR